MEVEFLGTGTSQGVPVIGCSCEVCTSGDERDRRLRASIFIRSGDVQILIDIGPDFRYQMLRASISDLDAVLITHEHNDHIAGLDDIRPINFLRDKLIDVYALPRVAGVLRKKYDYVFAHNPYPGAPRIALTEIVSQNINIRGVQIECLPVYHGKLEVLGYRIGEIAYITDANQIPEKTFSRLQGVKILILNALRKEVHHSHFNLDEAIRIGEKLEVKKLYLTHISHAMGLHTALQNELPDWVEPAFDGMHIKI